jgi:hypothetical protein
MMAITGIDDCSSAMARQRRCEKLKTWLKKTEPQSARLAELPLVNGVDKIRVLRKSIVKKEIIKGRDGEFIINNCGPVSFKKRE